jgi:hypothetical protein
MSHERAGPGEPRSGAVTLCDLIAPTLRSSAPDASATPAYCNFAIAGGAHRPSNTSSLGA